MEIGMKNAKLMNYEVLGFIANEQKLKVLPGNELQNDYLKNMPSSSISIEPDINTIRLNHCSFSAEYSRKEQDHSMVQLNEEEKDPSRCDHCSFITTSPVGMRKHKFSVHKESAFNCTQCDFGSWCQSIVGSHMLFHSANELRKCSQCSYTCFAEYCLKRHINKCHNSGEKVPKKSKECATQPSNSAPCSDTNEPPYKCMQCSYSTDQKWNLYRHNKAKHSGDELLKCSQCYFTCKTPYTMTLHMSRHTDNLQQCEVCSKVFTKSNDLKTHMRIHTGQRPYKCPQCDYSSAQRCSLYKHMLVHSDEKPHKCTECDFATKDPKVLKVHMYRHTGGRPKPFLCEICSRTFAEKGNLKKHLMWHTGNRPHKCTICSFSSVEATNLASHMLKHSGERPYKCDKCNYAGVSAALLRTHVKVHSGVKPKKCPDCEYSCRDTGNLRKHMWIHSGVRPLKCPECPYACRDRSALKTHIARHSKETQKE